MYVIVGFVWQNRAEAQMYLILFIYLLFLGNEMKMDIYRRAGLSTPECTQSHNLIKIH